MNELTANQFNAGSVFGGNMPLGFINYSMDVISNYFQQPKNPPQTGRPEDFEEVIFQGRKVLRRKRTQIEDILALPSRPPVTPPIAGGQNPAITGVKKCDANNTFFDRIFGRCCVGEIRDGKCILVSDGKGTIGDEPTHSGKKVDELLQNPLSGLTDLSTKTVVILVGLILLIAAVVSLR
ncbi:hypothetical protein L0244_06075 [bacterium]|nr:hypothetical protein [bacterium]